MILLFCDLLRVVEYTQNRPVGDRTESPFPIVIVGNGANPSNIQRTEKRVQGDVYFEVSARNQSNALQHGWEERGSRDFDGINTRQQPGSGVETQAVRESGKRTGR